MAWRENWSRTLESGHIRHYNMVILDIRIWSYYTTTSMEDNLNVKQPQWKTTSIEDNLMRNQPK